MDDDERYRASQEAFGVYVRLLALLDSLAPDHPARPHLRAAVAAADRHWRALTATEEDRVLDQLPARRSRARGA